MTNTKESKRNEKAERKAVNTITKRIKRIAKVKVQETFADKADNDFMFLVNECKDFSQAKTIDFLLLRKVNYFDVVRVLAHNHYHADSNENAFVQADKRMKRHVKHDKESRIQKRNS